MFETFLQRKFALNLRIRLIILFVVLPDHDCRLISSKFDNLRCNLSCPLYRKEKWSLAPLGKASSEFISLLYLDSTSRAIHAAFEVGIQSYDKFVYSVISYVFIERVPVMIIVALSSLIVFLLLLTPYFIGMYRRRQIADIKEKLADGSWQESRIEAWLVFKCVGVFLAIAFFGAIFMSLSANNFDDNIYLIFTYSAGVVNTSFVIKENINEHYNFNLPDLTNSILKVITSMYNLNFIASNDFIRQITFRADAVDYHWRSVTTNILSVQMGLKSDQKKFQSLLSSTSATVWNNTQAYRSTLNALKSVFDKEKAQKIFGPVVDPLLTFPEYSLPSITSGIYDYSIQKLDELSKLSILTRVENLRKSLHNFTEISEFDPNILMSQLMQIGLDAEFVIRDRVGEYLAFIDVVFKEKDRNAFVKEITEIQKEALKHFHTIFVFIIIFSILGASFSLFFFLVYSLGVFGTKGFRLPPPDGVCFVKSGLSHSAGKIIIVSSYFAVVFLSVSWAFGSFLFLLSAVPSQLCLSADSGSLFNATIDHPSVQNTNKWFSMFSSNKFNTSLAQIIIKCNKDFSYFSPMDNFKIDKSSFDYIKATVDTSNIRAEVERAIQNFTYINIIESDKTAFNIQGILNIYVHLFFKSIQDFLHTVSSIKSLKILTKIRNHPSSSGNLKRAASNALNIYKTFTKDLESRVAQEIAFNSTLKSYSTYLSLAQLGFDGFIISAESLDIFIKQNGTNKYMSILNSAINKNIDDCFHSLNYSVQTLRNSMSFCAEVLYHYEYLLHIVCERILYPISLCWMGATFVNIFFLLSVFLCLYSVTSFLMPPEVTSTEPIPEDLTVFPEDLPSTIEVKEFISHYLRSETDIPAVEAESNNESCESDPGLALTAPEPDDRSMTLNKEIPLAVSCEPMFIDSSSNFMEDAKDAESDDDHEQIKSVKSAPLVKSESIVRNSEGRTKISPIVGESSRIVSQSIENTDADKKAAPFKGGKSVEGILRERTKSAKSSPSVMSELNVKNSERKSKRSPKVAEKTAERDSQPLENTDADKKTVRFIDKSVEEILRERTKSGKKANRRPKVVEKTDESYSRSLENTGSDKKTDTFKEEESVEEKAESKSS